MEEGKKKKVELPNFYAPMYAEYIWKDHAPNFKKYIDELDSGDNEVSKYNLLYYESHLLKIQKIFSKHSRYKNFGFNNQLLTEGHNKLQGGDVYKVQRQDVYKLQGSFRKRCL